jgi:FMN phosphatase YigB (HAD superfamily)
MSELPAVVFLVDIDNTLLDNDHVQADMRLHFEQQLGVAAGARYWAIQEALFKGLGYRDYLGALQRFREEQPLDIRLLDMGLYLMNYPFADRLYPDALVVLQRLQTWGPTVVLSDGDAVFQPRKAERSGLAQAVQGRVLIYIHKEDALDDVERRYPAGHYVVIDDKLRILAAVKRAWGDRVTTVFPQQGALANDAAIVAANPPADVTVQHVGDLLKHDLPSLLRRSQSIASAAQARR